MKENQTCAKLMVVSMASALMVLIQPVARACFKVFFKPNKLFTGYGT